MQDKILVWYKVILFIIRKYQEEQEQQPFILYNFHYKNFYHFYLQIIKNILLFNHKCL